MGMVATQTDWTVEMVQTLPDDGNRYETVDGELFVTPAPSFDHQTLAFALARRLALYVETESSGHMFMAPVDFILGPRTLVQPDVVVTRARDGGRPRNSQEAGVPLLAVEIMSPSSARADRVRKRDLYQRVGVAEYWIVDSDARVLERWRPEDVRPEILTEHLTWQPEGASAPFVLNLAEYWAEVFG